MLSSVLHSERAVQVNIEVVRTFVRLRRILATHEDLARKMVILEKKYDAQFKVVFDAIRELMASAVPAKRRIGLTSHASRQDAHRDRAPGEIPPRIRALRYKGSDANLEGRCQDGARRAGRARRRSPRTSRHRGPLNLARRRTR
jgi:hypothetical protein